MSAIHEIPIETHKTHTHTSIIDEICFFNSSDVKLSNLFICLFVITVLSFIAATLHMYRIHIKKWMETKYGNADINESSPYKPSSIKLYRTNTL